jgi:hypothetical protein
MHYEDELRERGMLARTGDKPRADQAPEPVITAPMPNTNLPAFGLRGDQQQPFGPHPVADPGQTLDKTLRHSERRRTGDVPP